MILVSSMDYLKEKYKLYGNEMLDKIKRKYGTCGTDIKLKVQHGLSMCDAVGQTTVNSGLLNDSYLESGQIDGLLHDIGRFEQYLLSGTLKDYESRKFMGFDDHGRLGSYLLTKNNNELLRYFIPNNDQYDYVLKEVIKEHTNKTNLRYYIPINDLINVFQQYEISEVLESQNEYLINKLIALKLLILREEDSLEILEQVKDGLLIPNISVEKKDYIKDIPWELFINFEYLNMGELKQKNLWTCNAIYLLRYSLLFQNINFVGTLKTVLENQLVELVYKRHKEILINKGNNFDPRFELGYEYTKLALENLINTSPDGKIITPESRELAKVKTLLNFK